MTSKRAKKAAKNSGKTGTAKGTGSTISKTQTGTSSAKAKEREAKEKVAAAMKKINEDLASSRESEWSGE